MRGKWIFVGIGWIALVLAGCSNYEFNRRTMRFERVGPRPRPHVAISDQDREQQFPPPAQAQKADLSTKQRNVLARGQVFRLYLGDASVKKSDELRDMITVRQTTPEKLAELANLLFPGEGPGGSERIRWIVYSNEDTLSEAMEFVPKLDVAASGSSDWSTAIGLIYESDFPRKIDPDARFRIATLLTRVVDSPTEPTDTRWAAGILAANLYARYEPKDLVAASTILSRTGKIVRGQDYKGLVVKYHYVMQLKSYKNDLSAKKHAQEALNTFQSCEDTDCYRMLRALVETQSRSSMTVIDQQEKTFTGNQKH